MASLHCIQISCRLPSLEAESLTDAVGCCTGHAIQVLVMRGPRTHTALGPGLAGISRACSKLLRA